MEQTTFVNLPEEVLRLIFNRLNFHGHLRLGTVCRRFHQVIENDAMFMRTVNFRAEKGALQTLADNPQNRLMHSYSNAILMNFQNFDNLSALVLDLLESVENVKFQNCFLRNTNEFVTLLNHCKTLKSVCVESRMFEDLKSGPREKCKNPVSLSIPTAVCQSLNCFERVTHIHIRSWNDCDMQDMARFLSNHAMAVNAVDIFERNSDELLQLLINMPELKLRFLNLYSQPTNMKLIAQLFSHQLSSLTELTAEVTMMQPMFDAIRLNLVNLQSLAICVMHEDKICLNDLKVLPKLKSLSVDFQDFEGDYKVDIGDLSLEQLRLAMEPVHKLILERPNWLLKKLVVRTHVDDQLLNEIANKFSNLTNLALECCRNDYDDILGQVENINKLAKLHSFSISSHHGLTQLVNNELLGALKIPTLKNLNFCDVERSFIIHRTTLSALAWNCPKLLRVTNSLGRILFKRMNGTRRFRRVHRPVAMEDFSMDCDSMDSCSDDEDGIHSLEISLQSMFV